MGLFAYSLSIRRTPDMDWDTLRPRLEMFLYGKEAAVTDLTQDLPGYGMISLSPDTGAAMPNLAQRISKMTGDYVVNAQIVDSDFALLQLYYNGEELEECYIGRIYLEIWLQCRVKKPKLSLWMALLQDTANKSEYRKALRGMSVFVEDQLRVISDLTGLPVFDDALLSAAPEYRFF